jgi:hypothetical protein
MKNKLLLSALCGLIVVGCKHDMNTGHQDPKDSNPNSGGGVGYQPDYNNPNSRNFNPNSPNFTASGNVSRNWQTNSSGESNTNRMNGQPANPANPVNK